MAKKNKTQKPAVVIAEKPEIRYIYVTSGEYTTNEFDPEKVKLLEKVVGIIKYESVAEEPVEQTPKVQKLLQLKKEGKLKDPALIRFLQFNFKVPGSNAPKREEFYADVKRNIGKYFPMYVGREDELELLFDIDLLKEKK